jgi:RNA polymerase sigma-70 factor (ECF subfamily)
VPVGTVRSRLSEVRRKLAAALRSTAEGVLDDAAALTARGRAEADFVLASAPRGEFRAALAQVARPDLVLVGPQGQRGRGRDLLVTVMETDLAAGVRQRLVDVASGAGVAVWECALLSPPDDPEHCPPGAVWLVHSADRQITRIRLFHPVVPVP